MKQLGIATLIAMALMLAGCGDNSSSNNSVNGNWAATLTSPGGQSVFTFTTTLNSNGTVVSGTNLNFTTATPCFGAGATETGGLLISGNTNGVTASAFTLAVTWAPPGAIGNNVLNLQGSLNSNTIAGTWTLTGVTTGCSGSGNFTMTKQ